VVQGRFRSEPDRPGGLLILAVRGDGPKGQRTLLAAFAQACVARNLLPGRPSPADAFRIVRDMPYRRPEGAPPWALLSDWCGTCSGKHGLLAGLLDEMGIANRTMLATYRYTWTGAGPVPEALASILGAGPVPDVHTYLEIRWDGNWTAVDATWPRGAERGGLPVNDWTPGDSHRLALTPPYTAYRVDAGTDPRREKERLIRAFVGADLERREAFIVALSEWAATFLG